MPVNGGAVVSIRDLLFSWSGDAPTLSVEKLDIAAGEQLLICGPSGCGKSTLLGLLGCVLLPESGSVRVLGRETSDLSAARRDRLRADHIGFVFQAFNLIPYLSVFDNLRLAGYFSPLRGNRMAQAGGLRAHAGDLMRRLGLPPGQYFGRRVIALSIGQQQRVALARALLGSPEILLADEPTSALDDGNRLSFLELLKTSCREAGAALVLVSHDRRLLKSFNRIIDLGDKTVGHASEIPR